MVLHLAASDGYLFASTGGRGIWRMPLQATKPRLTGFTIEQSPVTGGNPIPVRVTIDRPAPPGGVAISITSNNQAAVPNQTVTILQGFASRVLNVSSNQTSSDATVQLTASANGGTGSGNVVVQMVRVQELTVGNFQGGNDFLFSVHLDKAAPQGGAVVSLSASDSGVMPPPTITVAAGNTSATGLGTSSLRQQDRVVSMQATRPGSGVQRSFAVLGTSVSTVTLTPAVVWNTERCTMRVTLYRVAPKGGFTVTPQSGMPNVLTWPSSVTIPQGQSSVNIAGQTRYVLQDTLAGTRLWDPWGNFWEREIMVEHVGVGLVRFTPPHVVNGQPTLFTVRLDRTLTRPFTFALLQAPSGFTDLPAQLTVSSGERGMTTPVTTQKTSTMVVVDVWARIQDSPLEGAQRQTQLTLLPLLPLPRL